jgi:uroporphyrinogen-III decarboxylase
MRALAEAIQLQADWMEQQAVSAQRMAAAGFPSFHLQDCVLQAPFDFLSDALRGMRGIFLDMRRCPDKLLAAGEKMARLQLQNAFQTVQAGPPGRKVYSFTATHRGSDEFISVQQFERFYWPQYKDMLLKAIEAGITPFIFYEGTWNHRLKHLAELPKGKTIGYFHNTDLFRAKEVIGDTMCIMGGMPVSLLAGGTVQEVREHTRRICEIVGKGGGFIMATSTGELEGCNPELVKAWVDATKEFGPY